MSIDIGNFQDDQIQACKDLVEWWRTGILGESTTLRRVADEQYDGDTRRAESMLKDQLVVLAAKGGIEDLITRLREAEQREQALAAHVECFGEIRDKFMRGKVSSSETCSAFLESARDAPETNLAQRDAEQQQIGAASFRHELMESVKMAFRPHIQGVFSVWLERRQAKGGDA